MSSYQQLVNHFEHISHLQHLQSICAWDGETMMPSGSAEQRSKAMAELDLVIHKASNKAEIKQWLAAAESEPLTELQASSLREMKRQIAIESALPESLVKAKRLAGSQCEHQWRSQRANNDWQGFKKNLKEVVKLSREEAQIRAQQQGLSPYDAMLDLYEPGMTTAELDKLFAELQTWLPELITQVQHKQANWHNDIDLRADIDLQHQLSLKVMSKLGFEFNLGRLDVSAHPFSGGVPTDLRITTHYHQSDFSSALFSTIHETGHACYEQYLPAAVAGLPAGLARSMAIHEGMSLFYEMQLGRDPLFLETLLPELNQTLNKQLSLQQLTQHLHKVSPSYIRIEADEVTYPAHIILRYQIEKAIIAGDVEVDDLPDLWQQLAQQLLGIDINGNHKLGVMQDIHWTDGSFGYFPSYTLGAMYAAQFKAAMAQQLEVTELIKAAELGPIFNWLKQNIWSKGSLLTTSELVIQATGEALNPKHFEQHLKARYL
nr:carboxypeptidase M32 [Paraferrimonas sp. SM1919]